MEKISWKGESRLSTFKDQWLIEWRFIYVVFGCGNFMGDGVG